MKPKRIILIRHGESESNIEKAFLGQRPDYTSELTSNGLIQADLAGQQLKSILGQASPE